MIFESISKTYEVINLTVRHARYKVYKCKSGGADYILYLITDEELKRSVCVEFQRISETEFDGLCEMFTVKDNLVIVMEYHDLSETGAFYTGREPTETEKVRFFGDMLAALCIHAVPNDIAADLIDHDNVGLTSDGNPQCRYELKSLLLYGNVKMKSVSEAFVEKLREAFESVPHSKRTAALESFCAELEKLPPADIMELYSRYEQCVEPFAAMGLGETRKQRMKRFAMKAVKVLKTVVAAAILVVAFAALFWSFFSNKPESGGIYEQIGDVKIEEYRK